MRYLRQNTAVSVVVGPFVDWGNGKSLLRDQADFTPSDITCELIKGITSSILTLTKTGGVNDIVLTGKGLATLELTAADTDTLGQFRLSFADVLVSGFPSQTILSFVEDFMVMPANVYDSLFAEDKLQVDINQVSGVGVSGVNDFKADVSELSTTAEVQSVIDAIGTLNDVSKEEVITALMSFKEFTEGGVLEFAILLKNLAAWIEGTWKQKAGTTDTWQVSDADDKDENVLEVQLKEDEDPYKQVTRL